MSFRRTVEKSDRDNAIAKTIFVLAFLPVILCVGKLVVGIVSR